jgi:hypothetical protein
LQNWHQNAQDHSELVASEAGVERYRLALLPLATMPLISNHVLRMISAALRSPAFNTYSVLRTQPAISFFLAPHDFPILPFTSSIRHPDTAQLIPAQLIQVLWPVQLRLHGVAFPAVLMQDTDLPEEKF